MGKVKKYGKYKGWVPDGGTINAAKEIYGKSGAIGFWKGYNACAYRAMLANQVMFLIYEPVCKKLKVRSEH